MEPLCLKLETWNPKNRMYTGKEIMDSGGFRSSKVYLLSVDYEVLWIGLIDFISIVIELIHSPVTATFPEIIEQLDIMDILRVKRRLLLQLLSAYHFSVSDTF